MFKTDAHTYILMVLALTTSVHFIWLIFKKKMQIVDLLVVVLKRTFVVDSGQRRHYAHKHVLLLQDVNGYLMRNL